MTAPTKLEEALDEYEDACMRYGRYVGPVETVAAARAAVLAVIRELAGALEAFTGRQRRCVCYVDGCQSRAPDGPPDTWCEHCRAAAALALVPRGEG